jgi:flavin reductase (DIM6/NTAB) family NADH-FMN oxidoreductase RutF
MPTSFEPNLYAIAIGKTRFSAKLIGQSKVFCVNFIPLSMEKEAAYCGRNSGEHIDKFEEGNILKEECEKISCLRLKEAIGFMECEVINEVEAGDHIIFIGKVLYSELKDESAKRLFQKTGTDFTTTK